MSTDTINSTIDFLPARETRHPRGVVNSIRILFASIREGIDAADKYERLTARGVSPQKAVDIVFRDHFADRR